MILPYQMIKARCNDTLRPLVAPCVGQRKAYGMSYGLGPAGYDVRLNAIEVGDFIVNQYELPPGGFVLGSTIERFNIPNDLLPQIVDKSSWARKGLCIQNTVGEPGWRGHLTLEITNHSSKYIHIEHGMPICQILFFLLAEPTDMPYDGKYQDQSADPVRAISEKD